MVKRAKKVLKNFQFDSEQKLISDPNKKRFFNHVNSKLKSQPQITSLEKCGSILTNPIDQANALNDQFCSVFTEDNDVDIECNVYCTDKINSVFLSRKIFEDALKSLPDRASCGPDSLPSWFLKKFAAHLSNPLYHIFSKSMSSGKLPGSWKIGKIIPIYKGKGKKCDPSNYRPYQSY